MYRYLVKGLLILCIAFGWPSSAKAQVRINEISHGRVVYQGSLNWVELYNAGSETVNVSSMYLCDFPIYPLISDLTILSGSYTILPGEYLVLSWNTLDGNDAEVGFYSGTNFSDPSDLLDYMQYGTAGHQREGVAVSAGEWTAGEFVPLAPTGETIQFFDNGPEGAGNWESGMPTPGAQNMISGPPRTAPLIMSTAPTNAIEGEAYNYDVEASGFPVPTFSLVAAPTGMTIDGVSGIVSWTPSSVGSFNVTIRASNSEGSDDQQFSVEVLPQLVAPTITSSAITNVLRGNTYTYDVEASGNPEPTYFLITNPGGMMINSNSGVITWTPTNTGSFNVTVRATNSEGADDQSFAIDVADQPAIPAITSSAVLNAVVGNAYSYDVEASGVPPPSFTLATAPSGMSINATTGLISWEPTQEGSFNVVVQAVNSQGTDDQSFTISVASMSIAPSITSAPVSNAIVDSTYTYVVEATGNPAPTFSLSMAPAGMTIDDISGVISWTPTTEGSFNVSVVATNTGGEDEQSYLLSVVAATSTSISLQVNQTFQDYTQVSSYRLLSLPGNVDIDVASTLQGERGRDWNVFLDNGANENFFVFYNGSSRFRFRPGRGFWVLSKEAWSVTQQQVAQVGLDADGGYVLTLQNGWNIIATPFDVEVPWAGVLAANPDVAPTAALWRFDGSFSEATELVPYEGFYFFNDRGAGAELRLPEPLLSKNQVKRTPLQSLLLIAMNSDSIKSSAKIVLHEQAKNSLDRLDQHAPRSDFSEFRLHFITQDNVVPFLSVDARPDINEGQYYTFEIIGRSNSVYTFELKGVNDFASWELYLLNSENKQLIDLKQDKSITLFSRGSQSQYKLLIGSSKYIEKWRELRVAPELVLHPPFPNPVNNRTSIEYVLSQSGHVSLKVFDVLGREVVTLIDEIQNAGVNRMEWDGIDLSKGPYFIRLLTSSGESRTRMITKMN